MSSWLPLEFKKTILMIGEEIKQNPGFYDPKGSAALVDYKGMLYAVTAKHVIQNTIDPAFLFNGKDGSIIARKTSFLYSTIGATWVFHPNPEIDVAVTKFGIIETTDDVKTISESLFSKYDGVYDGEDVFFMGFPLSLSSRRKITPVIRQGCVALKFDEETRIGKITYPEKTIIIDGQVSGGNSGSPVFRKPSFIDMKTRSIGQYIQPVLIGIVSGHIESIIEDLYGKPIARENSGLGKITSTDKVIEVIDNMNKTQ